MKKVSTTALSKSKRISTRELFNQLLAMGFVEKQDDTWCLTGKGSEAGGEFKESKQYGRYIVWPENLCVSNSQANLINSTTIGRHFQLSANKINFLLSELGWLNKGLKGWVATEHGKSQGAIQAEDHKTGVPFVRWPESIKESSALIDTVAHIKGLKDQISEEASQSQDCVDFREKFPAKHRAADGHFVRSKAEMLIDNWLYMAEIVHAYERKLPIEEDVYCDFYIPTGKVYIEYWGYENDQKYLARKQQKIALYKKYGFNLIELEDKEVQNLDDVLPKLLLKFGVQAY